MKWIISFGKKNKMGSRQRYNHKAILFCTQDTIEGVSDLEGKSYRLFDARVPLGEFMKYIACRA
jgi:hypothetical protein